MRPNLLRSLLGMEEGPNGDEGPNPRGFYGPPLGPGGAAVAAKRGRLELNWYWVAFGVRDIILVQP